MSHWNRQIDAIVMHFTECLFIPARRRCGVHRVPEAPVDGGRRIQLRRWLRIASATAIASPSGASDFRSGRATKR